MAHRHSNNRESGSDAASSSDRGIGGTASLNRRDYVRLGAAAVGLAGLGTSAATSSAQTQFATTFQEYGQ